MDFYPMNFGATNQSQVGDFLDLSFVSTSANNSTDVCGEMAMDCALDLSLLSLDQVLSESPRLIKPEDPIEDVLEDTPFSPESELFEAMSPSVEGGRRQGGCNSLNKRFRVGKRRQPQRDDFETEEEYLSVWNKWRSSRDHNNESVKKSRARAKQQRMLEEQKQRRERLESRTPQEQIRDMEREILLLIKAFQTRHLLTHTDEAELRTIVGQYTGAA